jgi:hypothetical protein
VHTVAEAELREDWAIDDRVLAALPASQRDRYCGMTRSVYRAL